MGKKHVAYGRKGCGCGIRCGCGCCRGGPFAKFCLFLFNTVFLIIGVAVVGFGIWLKVEKNFVSLQDLVDSGLNDDTLSNAGSIGIGFGLFLGIVSALGCLAVCCSHKKGLIALYGLLMVVVFCCGIAAAIAYGVFKGKIHGELFGALTISLKKYQPGNDLATDWDNVQTWIGCCGSKGPKDYTNVSFTDLSMHVPITCCVLTNSDPKHPHPRNETRCQLDAYKFQHGNLTSSKALRTTGCYDNMVNNVVSKLGIIIGVGVVISTLQILGICMACGLCLDDDGERYDRF